MTFDGFTGPYCLATLVDTMYVCRVDTFPYFF